MALSSQQRALAAAVFGADWVAKNLEGKDLEPEVDYLLTMVKEDDTGEDFDSWSSTSSRWARDTLTGYKYMVEGQQPASGAEVYFGQTARKSTGSNPYFGNEAHQKRQEYEARQEADEQRIRDAFAGLFRGE